MSHTFGSLLRHLRRRQELTQDELAARLGYSRSMVAALESNRRLPDVGAVADRYLLALELTHDRESLQQLVDLALEARGHGLGPVSRAHPLAFSGQIPAQNLRDEKSVQSQSAHRVPLSPTPLIGREREVQRICDSIHQQHRHLITLVGPPGIGKTRLSLEAASRLQLHAKHGACFISLAGASEPDHLTEHIIDALGVQNVAPSTVERLIAYLRRQDLLLVLDNFEQIIGAAPLVARILSECAGVRIIVTSREPLHLRAEHIVQVQPLSPQAAADLFMARLDALDAQLALEEIDRATVHDICRRLDCLPLALELCAAQADFYSLDEILERLQSHLLDTVADGASDLPERHRTLRAAIGASYHALTDDEKRMLRTLAVFVGGCTPQAAVDLWHAGRAGTPPQPERLLRSLAAKSLLHVEATTYGDKRLHLLRSISDYARERIIDEGEVEALGAAHSKVILTFAQVATPKVLEKDGPLWRKRILREWDNTSAALEWFFAHGAWQEMAVLLLALNMLLENSAKQNEFFVWYLKLLPYVGTLVPDMQAIIKLNFITGAHTGEMAERRREIVEEYHTLVAQCQNPLIKAWLLILGAELSSAFVDPLATKMQGLALAYSAEPSEESRLIYGIQCSKEIVLIEALFMVGCNLLTIGSTAEASRYLEQSLQLAENRSATHYASATGYLGRVALSEGRLQDALEHMELAAYHAAIASDVIGMSCWHSFLGMAHVYAGNLEQAASVLSQAWEESCLGGSPFFMQLTTLAFSELALASGDLEEARTWIAESIRLSAQSSHELAWRNLHRILLVARLAAAEARDTEAASLYGLWQAYNKSIVVGPHGPVIDNAIAAMAEVRRRLGEREYQRLHALGSQLPRRETLDALSSYLASPA